MSPALEVRDLHKRYGRTSALDGLSFRAGRAQVTALLGPNGAGKTTTVQICAGQRRAGGGVVRVLGADPWREGRRLRPRVGVMPQDGGAYPGARPGELLRLFAAFAAHPLDPDGLLERVGLGAAAGTPYRRLSGGERQRLSLALAIVARPELVFLDEPTAGLDVHARRATWELIGQLRADGVSVLLTTHYLEEAERLADHVVIVDRGRLLAAGTPQEVTASGAGAGVRLRVAAGSRPLASDGLAAALGRRVAPVSGEPQTYLVDGPADPELLAALTRWCADHDVLLTELRSGPASLEETFVALTAGRPQP